jgi:hypothetical protein
MPIKSTTTTRTAALSIAGRTKMRKAASDDIDQRPILPSGKRLGRPPRALAGVAAIHDRALGKMKSNGTVAPSVAVSNARATTTANTRKIAAKSKANDILVKMATVTPDNLVEIDVRGVGPTLDETVGMPVAHVVIAPPKFNQGTIHIRGIAPYVQHKFSQKALNLMEDRQRAGSVGEKSRRRRDPKNFDELYELAQHRFCAADGGGHGIPAPAFRNAMIDSCRLAGFAMTRAKLSLFIVPDGRDSDGQPLVIIKGKPRIHQAAARNASGVADIRWRPMFEQWSAAVTIRWDARQFNASDVVNLMAIAGQQVGIGEGRPSSPDSNGLDWGMWEVIPT